jgi:hypothetical protein
MWFDTTHARDRLGWEPTWSTDAMFAQSYDWFVEHRNRQTGEASQHRRSARQGLLAVAKRMTGLLPRVEVAGDD